MRRLIVLSAAACALAFGASDGRGQDAGPDPFAEPSPARPPAAPDAPPRAPAQEPARLDVRLRGVAVVAGRAPAALLETAAGELVVARPGDVFGAGAKGAVECRVEAIEGASVRLAAAGRVWVLR